VPSRDLFSFVLLRDYWNAFCLCFLLCVYIDLGGGLPVSGISRGWLHTRGAIARPGEDSFLYGFTFGIGVEERK
jgi:hypothetical protein